MPRQNLDCFLPLATLGKVIHLVLFLFLFISGFAQNGIAADGFWIMAKGLSLDGQQGWNYYNAGDAPEGAYMGWMYSGASVLNGTVPLQRSLSPGRYYVFMKAIDYMGGGRIRVMLGGGSGEVGTNNDDWNKYWTLPVTVDVTASANTISISLIKTRPITETQKYLVRGLYITSNPNENFPLYGFDRIINFQYPSVMDNSPAKKGNMIANGSFEVGIGYGWGILAEGYARDYSLSSLWDNTVGYHGRASLRLPRNVSLISRVVRVSPNKKHTLSLWAKASSPCGMFLEIYGVFTQPAGYPSVTKLSQTLYIDTTWKQVSLSGYLTNYPSNEYQIRITSGGADGILTWIDAVQLEEGELSEYAPKRPSEVGLVSTHLSNLFFEDESVVMDLTAYNGSGSAVTKAIVFSVYDHLNRIVKEGTVNVNISAMTSYTQSLNLSTGKRGIFRVVLSIEGDDMQEEVVYSIIPRPRNITTDTSSIVGIHPNLVTYQLQALQKMGIKWARAMSPAPIFRWKDVEPVEGQILWYDADVQKAVDNGFTILGTISTNNYWPAWADVGGMPDLAKWESFVARLVLHYRGKVKFWEIWNEPVYVFSTSFYAEMLKRAANAIRRSDPDAKIVGMAGGSYTWIIEVLNILGPDWRAYLDYISMHLYPTPTEPNTGETGLRMSDVKRNVIDPYSVEVWNTETGAWDEGFYKGPNSNFVRFGEPAWAFLDSERYHKGSAYEAERAVSNFLHCIGNGLTKYFYADSRIYATPEYLRSHPTIMEYDDTVRSKGIAYSIAGYFFDHSTGLGNMSVDSNRYYVYVFDRGGVPLAALRSLDGQSRSILVSLPGASLKAYDMMGNAITTDGLAITFGMYPVYVESQGGVSISDFRDAFKQGTVSLKNDTSPPNVSIDSVEKTMDGTSTRIRWGAIDDTSIPTGANPNAILYSYQLEGFDTWSGWTPQTVVDYRNTPAGNYVFSVKAKDQAGNVSAVATRPITIRDSGLAAPKNLRIIQ